MRFFQKNIGIICSVFILAFSIGFYAVSNSKLNDVRAENKKIISSYENEIAIVKSANSTAKDKVVSTTFGVDKRLLNDSNTTAKDFLNKVFSWENLKQYTANRNYLKKTYSLSDSDEFLSIFMPEIKNSVIDGKSYNKIDTYGLNMTYRDFKPYLVSISGGYRFLSVVNVSSSSANGGEAIRKCIFGYTVNRGSMKDLSASYVTDTVTLGDN